MMNFLNFGKRTLKVLLYSLRALLPQNASYAQQPDDDVNKKGTRRGRMQAEGALSGRSMVEMLGVLAIIGVLSVGAIAGYSKAMLKYKLNKHAESVNALINYSIQNIAQFEQPADTLSYYNTMMDKLNLIPEGMTYSANGNIYDNFNNAVSIYHNNLGSNNHNAVRFNFDKSSEGALVCQNILVTAKENHEALWVVNMFKSNNASTAYGQLYGDNFCDAAKSVKCLKDLTINDIAETCHVCDDDLRCQVFVTWK